MNKGKITLQMKSAANQLIPRYLVTYTTVMTDAAKLARDELTVCRVPDKDESTVSTSLLNRFSIRPR